MSVMTPAPIATVSVVVPTFRRPGSLRRCLEGLASQRTPPHEVIVVRRSTDAATTAAAIPGLETARLVEVRRPGVVFAMAAGAASASGDVVAFCDDDAVPRPDWVQRLSAAFAESGVGAFGGRDVLGPPHPEYPPTTTAGVLNAWGRLTGDHHRVVGAVRDVDVLKAVNMAFRRSALRFPRDLRGQGAQVHFEVPMCLAARSDGWAVRLDPGLLVDHLPEMRFDADRRDRPTLRAISDSSFNYTYGLLSVRPSLLWRRALFGVLVGDTGSPGIARAAVALTRRDTETLRRLMPSIHGQAAALIRIARGRSLDLAEPQRLISD
jgi:glycosyltransferase involved in cell wall biosynthesis